MPGSTDALPIKIGIPQITRMLDFGLDRGTENCTFS
jgi:hypothetical protein